MKSSSVAFQPISYARARQGVFPLAAGSDARPCAVDWHNRGECDLLVARRGGPDGDGIWLYLVVGRTPENVPIYDGGRRLPELGAASFALPWGVPTSQRFDLILARGCEIGHYRNVGNAGDPKFREVDMRPLPLEVTALGPVVQLAAVDVDDDGVRDLLLTVRSETAYFPRRSPSSPLPAVGMDDQGRNIAWTPDGQWRGGPMRQFLVWLRNHGTLESPEFSLGSPVLQDAVPADFGSSPSPALTNWALTRSATVVIMDPTGRNVRYLAPAGPAGMHELGSPTLVPLPTSPVSSGPEAPISHVTGAGIARSGMDDLLIGCRPGTIEVMLAHRESDGAAVRLSARQPLWTEDAHIHLGESPVPVAVSWGDGSLPDLLVGTAEGEILHLRNEGSLGEPSFAPPQPVTLDGRPFRIQAGPTGALRGPADASMGYVCPEVVDWGGNGGIDLLVADGQGWVTIYRHQGPAGVPDFGGGQPILKGDQPFQTLWRVRPSCIRWANETLPSLLALDLYGFLNLYRRDGQRLRPGRRLTDPLGRPIQLDGSYDACGQVSLCACDWDGDGDVDIVVGIPATNDHVYARLAGVPCGPGTCPTLFLLENVGDNESPAYVACALGDRCSPLRLGTRSCSPCTFPKEGDGYSDLVVGSDDGRLYFVPRASLDGRM